MLFPSGEGKGADYYHNDQQRTFIKVPLNLNDKKVKQFHDKLVELDERLGNKEMRKRLGLKDSYKYQPIVRIPRELDSDDDDDEDKPKKKSELKLPYMKLKLSCFYDKEGKYDGIRTKLFKLKEKGDKSKEEDEGEMDAREVAQFQKYVCWKASFKAMVIPNKLWAGTVGTGNKQYGLSFKAKSIKVKSPPSLASDPKESDFLDSDDDSDVEEPVQTKVKSKKENLADAIDDVGSDSDDDNSDSDSDSESEDEKPKKKPKEKKGKRSTSSSH